MIPEINFTLPAQEIDAARWPEIRRQYDEMITAVLERCERLAHPELLVEFETLPPMTLQPEWGLELTRLLAERIDAARCRTGLKAALRLTPNDLREFVRPPRLRSGPYWEAMCRLFEQAAAAGAELLAIESTGGKELFDRALLEADLEQMVFALGVLAPRDMDFLWRHLSRLCAGRGILPSGDSACGFANTAMVLAEKHMIPRVLAAVIRVASVPRSLVAVEAGAVGPSKDCAYEGPFLKAITGIPIAMEGRTAACAHLSPIGNISQAVCDCWSNESVQNVQLLSGRAPVMSLEQLVYDCRLMNEVLAGTVSEVRRFRDWLAASDSRLDPQAYVLRPDVVLRLSERIAGAADPYRRTLVAVAGALAELRAGLAAAELELDRRELPWLDRLERALGELPETGEEMVERMQGRPCTDYSPEEYGL